MSQSEGKDARFYGAAVEAGPNYRDSAHRALARRSFWDILFSKKPKADEPFFGADAAENAIKRDTLEGGQQFTIIDAENGKIIKYRKPSVLSFNRIEGTHQGESYYLVPEGTDLIGAIAKILVLQKVSGGAHSEDRTKSCMRDHHNKNGA